MAIRFTGYNEDTACFTEDGRAPLKLKSKLMLRLMELYAPAVRSEKASPTRRKSDNYQLGIQMALAVQAMGVAVPADRKGVRFFMKEAEIPLPPPRRIRKQIRKALPPAQASL